MSNLNLNAVMLAGHITGDPELRTTAGGTNLVQFNLAVNRQVRQGQEAKTDFFRCIAFEKTGQFISQYFRKGSAILIEGRIQTGSYTDPSGVKKYTTDIIVQNAHFVDSKAEAGSYQPPQAAAAPQPTAQPPQAVYTPQMELEPVDEESLPF